MIPYSEDVYGFTYGGAKIERLASNEKTGLVVLWVKTRKGSIKIEVTKAGFISVDGIRVVPPKRTKKARKP